jgi:hypothetical protein
MYPNAEGSHEFCSDRDRYTTRFQRWRSFGQHMKLRLVLISRQIQVVAVDWARFEVEIDTNVWPDLVRGSRLGKI